MSMMGPDPKQLQELILQALEHEEGAVLVYNQALECAQNEDLAEEWEACLEEAENHVQILCRVCTSLEIDPTLETPGVLIVRQNAEALVRAMQTALKAGAPQAAQLAACESVVLAETRNHANWELLAKCASKASGRVARALRTAVDEVEDEEDAHLYRARSWCRELWLESLGMPSVLPPPKERYHAKPALSAARADRASAGSR